MSYNPRQLPLIPVTRTFGNQVYGRVLKLSEWEQARHVANTIRKTHNDKVIITKDEDNTYDLWVRLAKETVKRLIAAGIITKIMIKTVMDIGRER